MGRSIVFSLTVLGLVGLLAWKSREVSRPPALSRSIASEVTALAFQAKPTHAAHQLELTQQAEEAPLKMRTSLVIEPVSPEEDRKLRLKESSGKLTEFEQVQ